MDLRSSHLVLGSRAENDRSAVHGRVDLKLSPVIVIVTKSVPWSEELRQ